MNYILYILVFLLMYNCLCDDVEEQFSTCLPVKYYTPQGHNQPDHYVEPPRTRTSPYGMFIFENTIFKPECCPFSSYSSSRGCPCKLPKHFYDR